MYLVAMNWRSEVMVIALLAVLGCGGGGAPDGGPRDGGPPDGPTLTDTGPPMLGDASSPIPAPSCDPAPGGGSPEVAAPVLLATLADRWHEAWLSSPAVVDLDGDGQNEILVPRGGLILGFHLDGSIPFRVEVEGGRIWSPVVVEDLLPGRAGLEVAVASREKVYAFGSDGSPLPGFPASFNDELRALAAGDIDGDGAFELVAVSTRTVDGGGQRDIVVAFEMDGATVAGFPPNTTGAAGCDDSCSVTGGFDQTLALGDVNGDGVVDIFAPQDNAHMSLHDGTGRAFDAAPIFDGRTKFSGVRFLHDYALAQQGWAPDEDTADQAHFTNSAPAIADIDGDGDHELVVLGSVQNAAQSDRLRGVGLWVLHNDGTRHEDWLEPVHVPAYLAGLWDYDGTNVVGATNQVSVADLDPERSGLELVFAGFDGRIHAVDARGAELFSHEYTDSDRVLTGGVAVADLSGDGSPELVFNSYSPDEGVSALFILDAGGNRLHTVPLPLRGAMPVPTIADVDGDGDLDIVVSLKDGEDRERMVLVYEVPGSSPGCMPWPTGRANYRRDGFVP